jgi:hypothetical protein
MVKNIKNIPEVKNDFIYFKDIPVVKNEYSIFPMSTQTLNLFRSKLKRFKNEKIIESDTKIYSFIQDLDEMISNRLNDDDLSALFRIFEQLIIKIHKYGRSDLLSMMETMDDNSTDDITDETTDDVTDETTDETTDDTTDDTTDNETDDITDDSTDDTDKENEYTKYEYKDAKCEKCGQDYPELSYVTDGCKICKNCIVTTLRDGIFKVVDQNQIQSFGGVIHLNDDIYFTTNNNEHPIHTMTNLDAYKLDNKNKQEIQYLNINTNNNDRLLELINDIAV